MTKQTQQQKDNSIARFITLLVAIGLMWNHFGDQAAIWLIFYLFVGAVIGVMFVSFLQWGDKPEKKQKAKA